MAISIRAGAPWNEPNRKWRIDAVELRARRPTATHDASGGETCDRLKEDAVSDGGVTAAARAMASCCRRLGAQARSSGLVAADD